MTPSFDKDSLRIRFSLRDVIVATASFFVCLGAAALVFASPSYLLAVTVETMPASDRPSVVAGAPEVAVSTEAQAPTPSAAVPPAQDSIATQQSRNAEIETAEDLTADAPPGAAGQQPAPLAASAYLYGTVIDPAGKPMRGATVVIVRYVNGVSQRVTTLVSAADGSFSTTLVDPSGTYRIIASVDVGGNNVRGSTTFSPASGGSYGVQVTLIEKSYFLFLPIPGY